MSQKLGVKASVINTLEGMASLAGALGDATRAARLWGAAEAAREATGIALPPGERVLHEPYLATARSRLDEEVWEEALAEGRKMTPDEAAEFSLSMEKTDPPKTGAPEEPPAGEPMGKLTSRQAEVAVLVAQGLTNRSTRALKVRPMTPLLASPSSARMTLQPARTCSTRIRLMGEDGRPIPPTLAQPSVAPQA
jgi:hypothetical protein